MAQVDRSALVLHTAEQMFDLINDVERYPEFLPWCAKTEVVSRSDDAVVATLYLAKAGLKYSFTTRNQLKRPVQMTLELVEGPFSSLVGVWDFKVLSDEACKVSLNLQFEFSGKIAAMAMGKVFNQVATTLVDAFVSRADEIYD
ncbi:type II toxin-antitoxin system RatA family toxin [Neptuniibacter pectenicola]|jgi:ribosome-associated toxin RatA of RatAB toxin-antitoxin module|uniref:Type II toxin-antitoxin system RatA family toxin n=1 Tax=Neptuniibacter pectenicola TaxID=1806669 RepID=A0ABU9TPV4_9GAMM|nr:type II toxin-antitoxin system RatA family toxin [Neptuniibacter pectenicola]KXJ57808.1 MAG: cyclase [Neptuniibacter sp. Phe_28]|tara:strand:+ start:134 stop:565 length:432 start_codon:yes stop_codon:yes gene_type:complete